MFQHAGGATGGAYKAEWALVLVFPCLAVLT